MKCPKSCIVSVSVVLYVVNNGQHMHPAAAYEKKKEQPPFLVHYVAPSYWAWKGGDARLDSLKEFVDHLLCILPFEAPMCKAHGVGSTFVGHPVLEDAYMNVSVRVSWYLSLLA